MASATGARIESARSERNVKRQDLTLQVVAAGEQLSGGQARDRRPERPNFKEFTNLYNEIFGIGKQKSAVRSDYIQL